MQSVVETIIEASNKIVADNTTIENLNIQIADDDSNFDDIYDAIVDKGQSPTKTDRSTYAPAIEAISGGANLDSLSVTPSTSAQTITPTSPVDGYDEVNVAAVDNTIDANIVAGNIKKNVVILGVTGSYEGGGSPNLQNKSVTPLTSQQTVQADSGYDGLDTVTVGAVDASIDNNIVAGNIKKDVVILGVTGSYEGGGSPTLQTKTVTPSASQQVVTPDSGYDGLSQVTVDGDADLIASNIRKNVTIFGVTGNIEPEVSEEIYTAYVQLANTPNNNFERQLVEYNDHMYLITKDGVWIYNEGTDSFTQELSYNFPFQNVNCQSGQYGVVVGDNYYFGNPNNGFELMYYSFNSKQVYTVGVLQGVDAGYRCICSDGMGLYIGEYYGDIKYYDFTSHNVRTIASSLSRTFNCIVYYKNYIYGVAGDYVDKVATADGSVTNLFNTSNDSNPDYGRIIVIKSDDDFYLIGGYNNLHTIIQFNSSGTYNVIKTVTDSYMKATVLIHKGIMYGSCMNWDIYDQRLRKMGVGIKKDLILGVNQFQSISGIGINKIIVGSMS